MKVILPALVAVLGLCVTFTSLSLGDAKRDLQAQSIDLAVQKVKVADLERRVRELEEDMDRIAPHTGAALPPRQP